MLIIRTARGGDDEGHPTYEVFIYSSIYVFMYLLFLFDFYFIFIEYLKFYLF